MSNGHHTPPGQSGDDLADAISQLASAVSALVAITQSNQVILDRIAEMEGKVMSQITDWAAAEQVSLTAISATLDAVVTGIAALDAMITAFQNSPGTLSAADQAALDGIQAAVKALGTKAAAISTTPPSPTPPPVP